MSRHKKIGILVTAAALLLGVVGSSFAKPVLQEDFRGASSRLIGVGSIVPTRDGLAYEGPGQDRGGGKGKKSYVRAGLTEFNPNEGAVELDLTRSEKDPVETLVSFTDKNGRSRITFFVSWGEEAPDGRRNVPAFYFNTSVGAVFNVVTPGTDDFGNHIQVAGAFFKNNVPKGRTIHVVASWGAQGVSIYVDGVRLVSQTVDVKGLLGQMALVEDMVVGGMIPLFDKETENVGDRTQESSSLIANVQVHDKQLAPAEFSQPIVGPVPVIATVGHDAFQAAGFSGKLVAGDVLNVTATGTPGAMGSFDLVPVSDIDGKIALDWRGYGVYLENKAFFEEGEVDLREVEGYLVYVSKSPINLAAPGIEPVEPLLDIKVQSYTLKDLDRESPYYFAVLAEMRDGSLRTVMAAPTAVPMTEPTPGVYAGSYTAGSKDRYPKAVVIGRLAGGGGESTLADANQLTIDASLTIAVEASPTELRADEKSTSTVKVTVTDANQRPVSGHKIYFVLATTSQYTGVVGGGAFTEQVGGAMQENMWRETDISGQVEATYVAGFAAKTAIIVARDMTSNDTGAGWVKTFIQASVQLELEPVQNTAAMDAGYAITVTSSDEWLTADGKSQARITARVTLAGEPVEGHKVNFSINGNGSIRTANDTTDKRGEARAVYTAGKKIGIVLVTATDTTVDISGSVQIELRSDAPAKIAITVNPEKIPADGRSRAEVAVVVTDINDNPNENTEVEYDLASGGGQLRDRTGLTDRNGESTSEYVAGTTPGPVTIQITVRSTVPTDEEIGKARNYAVAVSDPRFF